MEKSIFKKWTIIPLVLLFSTIIYKLINLSFIINKSLNQFMLDFSTNISRLYLLVEYNFHGFVPLWFNGFKLFLGYPPGWYYFTLPLVYLTKNIFIATYISIILLFILNFFLLYLFGKLVNFSRNKILLFYTLLFGNAWFLTSITDIGRVSDLFAWSCFLALTSLIYYYKDNKINKYFILFTIFTSLLLLAHIYYFMIGCILILCLFFGKPIKEKIIIIFSVLISLCITSFWWLEFTEILKVKGNKSWIMLAEILHMGSVISLNTLALLLFLILFIFYIQNIKNKRKELLFYTPIVLLFILLFTRIMVFIPIFNKVPIMMYNFLFIFLDLYLFFKIDWNKYHKLKKVIIILILIFPFLNMPLVDHFDQSNNQKYNSISKDMINSLEYIDGKYVILRGNYSNVNLKPAIAYATVYYNMSTVQGLFPQVARELLSKIELIENSLFINKECNFSKQELVNLHIEYIMSFYDYCPILKNCGFSFITQINDVCIYKI